jgi:O-acetyl-ADP-ribose deacetylase (regulator of RNase III)
MSLAVLEGTRIHRTTVYLIKDDITDIDVDAFAFYAPSDLALGSGYGTAISVRGGPTIQQELEGLAPVPTGDAVVSAAGKLKAQYIVHAVGPRFQEAGLEGKLRATMIGALKRVEEKGIKRIAFPAMGAGYYGIAPDLCARVMLEVLQQHLEGETGIEEVVICVLDSRQYNCFRAPLEAMGKKGAT